MDQAASDARGTEKNFSPHPIFYAYSRGMSIPSLIRTKKNWIFVNKSYKFESFWVSDDPTFGLVREPFGGADDMIDMANAHIPNTDRGIIAVFSASFLPDAQIVLEWRLKKIFCCRPKERASSTRELKGRSQPLSFT